MMKCIVCTFNCAHGSRVARADVCDGGEWSLALRTKANGRFRPYLPCTFGKEQTFL